MLSLGMRQPPGMRQEGVSRSQIDEPEDSCPPLTTLPHSQPARRSSQKAMSPLAWPTARTLPSGLKASALTAASSPGRGSPSFITCKQSKLQPLSPVNHLPQD